MAKNKGGNRPGEDGPYRPPNPADAPPYPPKKLAKKNKKKGKKEPDWTIEDNYAKYASKFKRDPRTGPNIS